ncbi:MAG: hypothetical protein ABII90_04545 [Bacteroidota bacterium]
MNFLEQLHKRIDESNWDIKQNDLINKAFQEVNGKLETAREKGLLRNSEMERQVFAFSKSPEKGLSHKIAGTKELEDGSEIPFEWPNIEEWENGDFKHIRKRFDICKNLFARTEYGLVLYYSNNLKNNKDVAKLLKDLLDLSHRYYKKSVPKNDKEHYILYFNSVLTNAFHIANNRKRDKEIQNLFQELILFTSDVHNNWDISHKSTLRSIIDLTDFAIKYKSTFLKYKTPLKKYLDQNYRAAKEISKSYNWGAIYICDTSKRLADAIGDKKYNWLDFKAKQFEAMVIPAIETGNLAAVTFVESALEIYKKLKNKAKVEKLSKKYDEVRRMFRLGEIRQNLPDEENNRITALIKKEIEEKNSRELVEILCLAPMFSSLEHINKMAEEFYKASAIARLFPTSIIDKYGNTVDVFTEDEEKKQFNFWQAYGFNFQIGTQNLVYFFIEAFKTGKISYEEIINFLKESWLAKTYTILYNGHPFEICPLEVITPGIKSFFDELGEWKQEKNPNFICATDSLTTKIEHLLRFMCSVIEIPTFKDRKKINILSDGTKVSHQIKQEKNIDELLRDLEHREGNFTGFSEEHRKFIKFVLTHKAGRNIRHRVAHGLMDANEYGIDNVIILLSIILKISSYKFKSKEL